MNGEFINLDTAKKIQENKNMDKDLLKIIQNYGLSNQLKKLSEELYEFQEAVLSYNLLKTISEDFKDEVLEKNTEYIYKCVLEEYADLCVLLSQFELYFDLDEDEVLQVMRNKVDRQLRRIENESKSN